MNTKITILHNNSTPLFVILIGNHYFCTFQIIIHRIDMSKDINRLKVVLAEKKRTNKWLAEQLDKDPATVSKWCTNTIQPNVETLVEIAKCLNVEIQDLFWPIK